MSSNLKNILYVAEHEKTEEWARTVSDELIDSTYSNYYERDKVWKCREIYRKGMEDKNYDYLYQTVTKKVEDEAGNITTQYLVPPAKVRNIPIIRSMIRRLVSSEKNRPKIYRAFTTDAKNARTREDKIIQDITMRQEFRVQQRIDAFNLRSQMIQLRQEMLSTMPDDPQTQLIVQQMQVELQRLQQVIQRSIQLEMQEIEKIRKYYKYDYKTIQELYGETVTNYLIATQNLLHIMNRNFEEYCVTGKEIYFCDWEPGMDDPVIEQCFFEECYFPYNQSVNFLFEHTWGIRRQDVSMSNIVARWGHEMNAEMVQRLKNDQSFYLNDGARVFYTPEGVQLPGFTYAEHHASGSTNSDLHTLYSVYWKTPTVINIIENPNKHRSDAPPFTKVISQEEVDYYSRHPEKLGTRKLKTRVKEDLWRAVRVGREHYLKVGKHPVQHRDLSKKSKVSLPFIGHAEHYFYSNESIVWETKDIQELYNILFYQKELLIVLAGVRGIIVDLSQLPDNMEMNEVIYYMRQGVLPIQTLDEEGRQRNQTFNQWSTYDQTLAPAIQYIENTLILLKQLAGEITGVTDVMQGIVRPTDQVGTTEMAMRNSSEATERYYQEHETLSEHLFSKAVNLGKYAYKNGKQANFVLGEQLMQYLRIPTGGMDGDFRITMQSSRKQMRMLDEVQAAARNNYARGQMKSSEFIGILDTSSITEAKKLIAEYEEAALEMAQANQRADVEAQAKLKEREKELDARVVQMVEQNKVTLKQMESAMEEMKLQRQAMEAEKDRAVKQEEIAARSADVAKKVNTEAGVELEYLELEREKMIIDDQNTKAAMLIDAARNQVQMGRSKEKVKD